MSRPDRAKRPGLRNVFPGVEGLEGRQMLNAAPLLHHPAFRGLEHARGSAHAAHAGHAAALGRQGGPAWAHRGLPVNPGDDSIPMDPVTDASPDATFIPSNIALTPTQVRTAYGASQLPASNQGQGVTIAIIDVYDDATIASDVNAFSTYYGLPTMSTTGPGPTFNVVKMGNVPASPMSGSNDTSIETSIDVDWAHAMAPQANIVLVEVPGYLYTYELGGVQLASGLPGVVVVSTSYGSAEFSGEQSYNSYFTTAANNGVALTFDTGDDGFPDFPSVSPDVIAVGGTSLFISSARGRYLFEQAWGGHGGGAGGGGVSQYYAAPAFQSQNGLSYGGRAVPDVSLLADPETGVAIYDSYDAAATTGGDPWHALWGGTSLATPLFAGVVAMAQQDRIAAGLPTLNSSQINQRLYAAYNSPSYSTYFHDVTLGDNQYQTSTSYNNAGPGYDLATGIGSPMANTLVPLLGDTP